MGEVALTDIDYDNLDDTQLDVLERKIAAKYMQVFPWPIVLWGILNPIIWLSLWPLVIMDIVPLWIACPIAIINVCAAYLPSHDAQHSIIAREGQPLRWLNEFVGHFSLIPFASGFRTLRHTHFEHHNHTNDAELDPDIMTKAENSWDFFKKTLLDKQPGNGQHPQDYQRALERVGKSEVTLDSVIIQTVYLLVLFGAALSGYAIEAALLWWIPRQIADFYIPYYLSWKPHHPGIQSGRYRDTRAFRSLFGNIGSSGMQYHIIHHLYPRIPLMQTPAAYRELKPILERRGCDLGGL